MGLKVLVVASWFPRPDSPFGGIFVAEQAAALAARHEVRVLAPVIEPAGTAPWRRVEDGVAYRIIRAGIPARNLIHHFDYARRVVEEARDFGAHVIHAHVTLPGGFASVVAGRWLRRGVVITEHRGPFAALMTTNRDRLKARYALAHADAVIAVSRALGAQMRASGVRRAIEIVPNVVDTNRFRYTPQGRREGEPYRLLFAGILRDHNKNLPSLLRALKLLARDGSRSYRLRVVGDGEVRSECERLAAQLEVECEFLGALAPEALAREMGRCDLLVLTSRLETFGIVLAEALAVGRPVVATRCGGPEDIVTPETGRLVPVDDDAALAAAVEEVCRNLARYRPEALSADAARRFGAATVVSQLTRIYEAMIEPRRERRAAFLS
jgi:glycosyltransferase involved in cell wall biosynthesis